MSIFDLHSQVLADYRAFVKSYFTIADARAHEYVNRALDEEKCQTQQFEDSFCSGYSMFASSANGKKT